MELSTCKQNLQKTTKDSECQKHTSLNCPDLNDEMDSTRRPTGTIIFQAKELRGPSHSERH